MKDRRQVAEEQGVLCRATPRYRLIRCLPRAVCALGMLSATLGVLAGASVPVEAAPVQSINDVDFRNYTYELDGDVVKVRDGISETGELAAGTYQLFGVNDVDFGDLNGDGVDEAVVTLQLNTGGTGRFSWGRIYELKRGKVVWSNELQVGDRADGGVYDIAISKGVIIDDRFAGSEGACCPQFVDRYNVRFVGSSLKVVGPLTRRPVLLLDTSEKGIVTFLPKGNSSAINGYLAKGTKLTAGFFANRGQKVGICNLDVKVTVTATTSAGKVALTRSTVGCTTVVWPLNGGGTLTASSSVDTAARFEIIIR